MDNGSIDRRTYLKGAGAGGVLVVTGTAGCVGGGGGSSGGSGGNGSGNESATNGSGGENTIQIGSDIPYKPFEYRTNDDQLVGFDVEIADAVFGDQLGMTPNFNTSAFDTIIPSLNNGNFRVIMSAMTINDQRAQTVDFSDPYFTAYQTIVVLQNSEISSKADLRGRTVGVQKGTTGADAASDLESQFNGDLTIRSYDQIPDAFSALINNQVAAVINDNTVSSQFVAENQDRVRFVEGNGAAANRTNATNSSSGGESGGVPSYLTLTTEDYGIAFRQDDDDLRNRVNDALSTIRDDGTYQTLYDKYFTGDAP